MPCSRDVEKLLAESGLDVSYAPARCPGNAGSPLHDISTGPIPAAPVTWSAKEHADAVREPSPKRLPTGRRDHSSALELLGNPARRGAFAGLYSKTGGCATHQFNPSRRSAWREGTRSAACMWNAIPGPLRYGIPICRLQPGTNRAVCSIDKVLAFLEEQCFNCLHDRYVGM